MGNQNKNEILSSLSCDAQTRILIASVLDKMDACENKNIPTASRFLGETEQSLAKMALDRIGGKAIWYGGWDDAQRRVAVFLPEYLTEDDLSLELCDLCAIRCVSDRFHDIALTHRDYLGALMNLGITRDTVGDILIDGKMADLIVLQSVAPHILEHLTSVGRCRVDCVMLGPNDKLITPHIELETITETVASLRLDGVIAAAFNLSRDDAQKAVRTGLVKVCGIEAQKPDASVKQGDTIALRGSGRVRLSLIAGTSKKGRIRIVLERPKA